MEGISLYTAYGHAIRLDWNQYMYLLYKFPASQDYGGWNMRVVEQKQDEKVYLRNYKITK